MVAQNCRGVGAGLEGELPHYHGRHGQLLPPAVVVGQVGVVVVLGVAGGQTGGHRPGSLGPFLPCEAVGGAVILCDGMEGS